jgi:hypothetical protein
MSVWLRVIVSDYKLAIGRPQILEGIDTFALAVAAR